MGVVIVGFSKCWVCILGPDFAWGQSLAPELVLSRECWDPVLLP